MRNAAGTSATRGARRAFSGGIGGDSQIRTPFGPKRAEMVRPGDLIVTRDNGLQPVRMIWSRRLTRADMEAGAGRAPVRLKPRAIGPMMPVRDLLVASDHRVLVPGYRLSVGSDSQACLMAAADLAGASDSAYLDRSTAGVDLYTFIFDTHQIFTASGLPVECFLPNSSTMATLTGKLRKELVSLFPVLRKDPEAYPAAGFPEAPGNALRAAPAA